MSAPAPPLGTDAWRAAIGPRADRYLPIFEKIEARGGGWVAHWNWAAFAGSIIWFFYRRMPRYALGNLLLVPFVTSMLPMFLGAFLPDVLFRYVPAAGLLFHAALVFVGLPMYADTLYYRHLKRRLANQPTDSGAAARLAPSLPAAIGATLLGVGLPLAAMAVAVSAYSDINARRRVSDAIYAAMDSRIAIDEFLQRNKRLPTQEEGAGLARADKADGAKAVTWDAAQTSVIVTLGGDLDGKRLRLKAEVRDGAITWTCRNMDLPDKTVPVTCRN